MAYKDKKKQSEYIKSYMQRPEVIVRRAIQNPLWKKKYYILNKDIVIKRAIIYNKTHPIKRKTTCNKYAQRPDIIEKNRAHILEVKLGILSYYSNNLLCCMCCGEDELEFLTIDHINGGGNKHRKKEKITSMYIWLEKHNLPDGYRTLCMNCNFAHGHFGFCPHRVKP